ncbi:cysteine synthase family protein [Endozoicomonas gorgoniicola]|uniref:cysteine synthase n=1 Tax=Endozoicomonas gorgoniicola TaxID=1234144 RepID=A0ABT3MQQ6_9GAMM|nr:cysteine synthase family protein [Endozoicomonas gorgoniicola]
MGCTPVVELNRLTHGIDGRIVAKLEFLNPGSSKKDRIARQIIEDAEREGLLKPGQAVIELTSGNTGTGLAIVCAARGYHFIAVMSRGNSTERARMMKALGAEVVLVDQCPDSTPGQVSGADLERVRQRTIELTAERGAFRADQFKLEGSWRAHFKNTGPEIIQQVGHIDAFCDFVGSGGTFAGCSKYFKEVDHSIDCYIVEPEGAAVLSGEKPTNPNHRIQGGGYSMPDLSLIDSACIDGFMKVTDEDAMYWARQLAKVEGLFAGFSAGANLAAAMQLLKTTHSGKTIAILLCDSGLKYLSTDLWPE